MNAARVVLAVAVVGAAGYFAFRGARGSSSAPPVVPDAAAPAKGTWNPFAPSAPDAPERVDGTPKRQMAAPEPTEVVKGTPVPAGASVDVAIPYRAGTKSHYRISEAGGSKDRASGAVQWARWTWMVTTEVVSGDGSGAARVSFTIDSFHCETDVPFLIDFDSQNPDKTLLERPEFGRALKPMLAILGIPLEFEVDAGGVHGVNGVSAMSRRYEEALDTLSAKTAREAADIPTAETMRQRWGEILFPPVGGGTMKGGETRDVSFELTQNERWMLVAKGKLRVTHDDPDVFRVEFSGKKDSVEELPRPARNPMDIAIDKARVVASDDSQVASWRFDRKAGRLVEAHIHDRHRYDLSRRSGGGNPMTPEHEAQFLDVERLIGVELIDK